MNKALAVIALSLLSFLQSASADIDFLTSVTPSTDRRTTSGEYGARFWNTSGESVTITQVGRWVHAGNSLSHVVKIYSENAVLLASATVDCSGTENQFAWATLATPLSVADGSRIFILSVEGNGDEWAYGFGVTHAATDGDIGDFEIGQLGEQNGEPLMVTLGGWPNKCHGPVNFRYSSPVASWTKEGTVYTTNGDPYQVSSAMSDADPGDTVTMPAGTWTWGNGSTAKSIPAGVTLEGAGMGDTVINMHSTSPTGTNALVFLATGSVIKKITFNSPANVDATLFSTPNASYGWRISEIEFNQATGSSGYFLFSQFASHGLIDQCDIYGSVGNSELIFLRGPSDAWQVASSIGGSANVFVEDCTFRNQGYVCDANSNSRIVVRHNTITGPIKIDGHGVASNNPARSVRSMEVYNNHWTSIGESGYWPAIEIRGGTGIVFGNVTDDNTYPLRGVIRLTDYGVTDTWPNFNYQYQTPYDYPVADQIGVGIDPKVAASQPMYLWNNTKAGVAQVLSWAAIPQGAIDRYRTQTGNAEATFTMQDVIAADRDYFNQVASFNGTSGVGVGTKAQMNAITPTKAGVGFWVTDEADWNANSAGNDGQLYTWNGSAWVLKYTPYTYPHPLRNAVAVPVITLDPVSLTREEGLSATFTISATGNPTPTYQWKKGGVDISGATSSSYTIPAVVEADEGTYTCVATNSQGSDTSAGATLTVNPAGTAPADPTSVTLTAQGNRGFRISWTDAANNEIRYDIQWRVGAGSWTEVQYAPGTTSATILSATPGQVLEAQVRVVGGEGAGSWVAATPTTVTMPAASPVRRSKNGGAVRAGGGL